MPDNNRLNEDYDVITLKKELERAGEEIARDKNEAIRKAFDKNERVDRRIAKLEELSEIAKRDGDYGTVNQLFTQANKIGTETAQGLNMLKALHAVNPQYKYMQKIVESRLGKIKIGARDIETARTELLQVKTSAIKVATKRAIKVSDAQELLNKLIC